MVRELVALLQETTTTTVQQSGAGTLGVTQIVVTLGISIVSAIVGYFVGVARDRRRIMHEQRTTATVGLRSRVLRTATLLTYLVWEAKFYTDSDSTFEEFAPAIPGISERLSKVREEVVAMHAYYNSIKPWLELRTRKKFEDLANRLTAQEVILSDIVHFWQDWLKEDFVVSPKRYEVEKKQVAAIEQWAGGEGPDELPTLRADFESEVERVVGGQSRRRNLFDRRSTT